MTATGGGSGDPGRAQADAIRAALVRRFGPKPERGRAAALIDWSRGVTDAMVEFARPVEGMSILDVASGRGEPALRLATLIGESGRLVACDPSKQDLDVAVRQAAGLGLRCIDFCCAAAEALPFPAASFDLVTCQLGIALFADPARAVREMRRVLRRGKRVVLASWGGSNESTVYASTIGVIGRHVGFSPPDSNAPDPYRYGNAGLLANELWRAGFSDAIHRAVPVDLVWHGDVRGLWSLVRSTNPVIDRVLGDLPEDRSGRIVDEILMALGEYRRADRIVLPANLQLAGATNP